MTKSLKWRRDTYTNTWELEYYDPTYRLTVAVVPVKGANQSRFWLPYKNKNAPFVGRMYDEYHISYHSTQAAKKDLMEMMKVMWLDD